MGQATHQGFFTTTTEKQQEVDARVNLKRDVREEVKKELKKQQKR